MAKQASTGSVDEMGCSCTRSSASRIRGNGPRHRLAKIARRTQTVIQSVGRTESTESPAYFAGSLTNATLLNPAFDASASVSAT